MDSDEVECLLANMIYKVRFKCPLCSNFDQIFLFATRCAVAASRHPLIRPTEAPQARLPNPNHDSNEEQADGPQNLMKGYIARERGIVVLSKGGAFPGTGV
jgi:hypothetical protein